MNEIEAVQEIPAQISLAVDRYNCYPGEKVTFYLQFTVSQAEGAVVQFSIPRVMEVLSYELPENFPREVPLVIEQPQELILSIALGDYCQIGETYEISVTVKVETFHLNQYLLTESKIIDSNDKIISSESTQIVAYAKGKYLKHLPDIYERDDFVNRFLMMIESFWKPISQQIDQGYSYYDADLTPDAFIPWLASWVGLPMDSTLPLSRVRRLLKSAIMLYQFRGTVPALKKYLEIYTAGKITIIEKRARNFHLNENSRLGVEIALGKDNQPNSLIIIMHVHETELERMNYSVEMYLKKMHEIIRLLVPAHTVFKVDCKFDALDLIEEK
ncbi:MAG: hypothetical protein JEZ06_04550 [Anaerolineaceae bacterium]|nr:hypothetical protein [Anaerolineaceae bacterium]